MEDCVYRGKPTGQSVDDYEGSEIYTCLVHKECTITQQCPRIANCEVCNVKLSSSDPEFGTKWLDPLVVMDRNRQPTHALRNLLNLGVGFLVCGGPSATEDKLEALSKRGHFSLAVNNKAGHTAYRPQAFVFSDTTSKFSHSIWYDPAIMKFCPQPKMTGGRSALNRKDQVTKKFVPCGRVLDCPNVWGFSRRGWMQPDDTFFTENSAAWGNLNEGVTRTGLAKTVCTMLLGMRLLYYLGARTIYLVGVDFNMIPGREYSFNQSKESRGASSSNNNQYRIVNSWLCELQRNGTFNKYGLSVFNCNPNSGLRAFPYRDFNEAIEHSRGYVEEVPDLSHWYEKIDENKMDRIERMIYEGLGLQEIRNTLNKGITQERKKIGEETINTYIRILNERYAQ